MVTATSPPAFTRGALSFKGDKTKKKKAKKVKSQKAKHEVAAVAVASATKSTVPGGEIKDDNNNNNFDFLEDEMTQAERAAFQKKQERELEQLKYIARKSHRERVEDYNEKLSQLTEHNDIPRVSAAGNG